jgi:molybdenum cofactor cytidylyltransferase
MQTGIIILAAGNSSRLGQPKQLLKHHGKTLLQHVFEEAVAAAFAPIVIVFGSNADYIKANTNLATAEIVINENWQMGLATSIVVGMQIIVEQQDAEKKPSAMVITVCDQPFVSAKLLTQLVQMKSKTGSGIVASSYAGTLGTPVLFDQKYYDTLLKLQGDEGAKKLLTLHQADVSFVPFEHGHIDIDTEQDYLNLQQL